MRGAEAVCDPAVNCANMLPPLVFLFSTYWSYQRNFAKVFTIIGEGSYLGILPVKSFTYRFRS